MKNPATGCGGVYSLGLPSVTRPTQSQTEIRGKRQHGDVQARTDHWVRSRCRFLHALLGSCLTLHKRRSLENGNGIQTHRTYSHG